MEFTEKALILKTGRFREADLWLRLYTPQRGLLTAFAFGGSRSRRRFMGCLDPLNQVLFCFRSNRTQSYLSLTEGTLLQGRPGLRADTARLGPAVNCIKFFESVFEGNEGSADAFSLLSHTLDTLEEQKTVSTLFPLLFRARVAFSQGYMPDLSACAVCGEAVHTNTPVWFAVERGGIVCGQCAKKMTQPVTLVPVTEEVHRLLSQVCTLPPARWAGWLHSSLSGQSRQFCYAIIDRFVAFHLNLVWEEGRFRKT